MSKAEYWRRAKGIIKATQECNSMSDMDIMLQEVEHDTGYDKDFIYTQIVECCDVCKDWNEAIDMAITVAYEYDY